MKNVAQLSEYRGRKQRKRKSTRKYDNPDISSKLAEALYGAIRLEFAGAEFFTREDMLHLRVLSHVATISRYQTVRWCVTYLASRGKLVELNRTEIAFPEKAKLVRMESLPDQYGHTIRSIVNTRAIGESFMVMDIVDKWRSDPFLTTNAKRVGVRQVLRQMVGEGLVAFNRLTMEYVRNAERN